MKNQVWFVVISDDKRGPFSEEEIATLLKAGSLSERSLVWSKDALTDDWLPIFRSDLKHLVSGAEISPPALPPIEREINTKPATLLEQPTLVRADQSGSYSGPELTDWGSPNTTEIGQGSKRLETETSRLRTH